MEDYSMFVPNVHFEQIPIKNLVSNQEYQRNISEQHVLNAAAHFDLYQINPVKVSRPIARVEPNAVPPAAYCPTAAPPRAA